MTVEGIPGVYDLDIASFKMGGSKTQPYFLRELELK